MLKNEKLGHMGQKIIVDKVNSKVSEFIVFSNSDLTVNDWVFKPKFSEMVNNLSDKPVDYPLKRTIKGNPDESRSAQTGKALRISVDETTVTVGVYTQVYGESWKLSHTHIISKTIFNAYILIVNNETIVAEIEKNNKAPENFSLNLG